MDKPEKTNEYFNKDVEYIDQQIKDNKLKIPQYGKIDLNKRKSCK